MKGIGFYIKRAFSYNPFIREAITQKAAQADAAQAVAEAIYSCNAKSEQDKMRAAQRALYQLATELGCSQKKGWDNESIAFEETQSLNESQIALIESLESEYLQKPVKEIVAAYGIEDSKQLNKIKKLFTACFPGKGKKHKNKTHEKHD